MDRYFHPFDELDALRRGIDRIIAGGWPGLGSRGTRFLPGRSARGYPLVNLSGDDEKYVVEAFAPGLDAESLEVSVKGNTLTIAGEKKPLPDVKPEAYHRNERSVGKFVRTYQLDSEIDDTAVEAKYANGILRIALPKSAAAMPRKIAVRVK